MTGREFSEVDFDLLADYVGGALDGTPEEAVVAQRVADEPAWAEAHAALAEATGSVRASLASWGESAEPMPTEVADRIAAALVGDVGRPALSLVPDGVDGPRRTAPRARRRMPAWAAPAAIAAGVAALAGLGLAQADKLGGDGSTDTAAGTAAEAPASAYSNAEDGAELNRDAGGPGSAVAVAESGQDYRVLGVARPPVRLFTSGRATKDGEAPSAVAASAALDRLRSPSALADCIDAIARDHPLGVASVEVVDLASFQGSPAAIVFFRDGSGARWAWASGPECGQAARGADTLGSAKIG